MSNRLESASSTICLSKGSKIAITLEFVILFARFEVLYNRTGIAGAYNTYIGLLFVLFGFCACFITNLRFTGRDLICFIVVGLLVAWGSSKYSIIYGLIFCVLTIWDKFRFEDVSNFCRLLIVVGFICDSLFSDYGRATGFGYSAPMYAYSLSIALTYLVFRQKYSDKPKLDLLLIIIALEQTWETETRIFMAFECVVLLVSVSQFVSERISMNRKSQRVLFVLISTLLCVAVVVSIDYLMPLFSRDSGDDSVRTRLQLYENVLPYIVSSPLSLLFGHGGGFAMTQTMMSFSYQGNLPVHQDFLLYVTDYGFVGLIVLFIVFFKNNKWPWQMWLLLVIGAFHNIGTSSLALLLLFTVANSLSYAAAKDGV